jgi:hypothetical protein
MSSSSVKSYGTLEYKKGSIYVGEVVNGIREGCGSTRKKNGDSYTGEYKNNQRHGNGIYTYACGDKYEGQFVENKKHGYGIYTYATDHGTYYTGYWVNNIKHGYGTLVYYDGVVIQGIFENGTITSGEILFPNDSKYVGTIDSYAMHGHGKMTYSDGFHIEGEFVDDYLCLDGRHVCCYCLDKCDGECYESMEGICGSPEVFDKDYEHTENAITVGSRVRTKVIKNDLVWNQSYDGVVRKVNDKWIYVKFDDGDYLMVERDLLEMN